VGGSPTELGEYMSLRRLYRTRKRLFGNSSQQLASSKPPRFAVWCLYMFLPRNLITPVVGDIQEKFQTIMIPKVGRGWAVVWCYKETVTSIIN
jgi:hypothetical protein